MLQGGEGLAVSLLTNRLLTGSSLEPERQVPTITHTDGLRCFFHLTQLHLPAVFRELGFSSRCCLETNDSKLETRKTGEEAILCTGT